jgi:glycosyltransferase involved in cell wall biosynthesis
MSEQTLQSSWPTVLILTPVKDAAMFLPYYFHLLKTLTYPHHLISVGILEGDSRDNTWEVAQMLIPEMQREFASAGLWKQDFGLELPTGIHRGAPELQIARRRTLARARNHLLFHALQDQEWVLWLDVDIIEYPVDLIEQLISSGRNIVQPHCVLDYGGPTFDQNGWRDFGRYHLDDLRNEGDIVPLDAVGGTVLLVRANLHRDGLIFPPVPHRPGHPKARPGQGELETEGLGMLAWDMGETCWGMPWLEVLHARH